MGEPLWNKTHFPVQASVLDEGLHDFTVERIIALYLVLKEANNICQSCGKPGYDAHHKKPKECYPEARYDISNGMCLCRECHKKWHDTYGIMKIGGPGLDGNQ